MKQMRIILGLLVLGALLVGGGIFLAKSKQIGRVIDVGISDEDRAKYEQDLRNAQVIVKETRKDDSRRAEYVDALLTAGVNAARLGQVGLAESVYQRVIDMFPGHELALMGLAGVYVAVEDFSKAEAIYQRLAEDTGKETYLRQYVELVKKQNNEGLRDQQLLKILEESVVAFGQTSFLMYELGQYYEVHEECDLAISHYKILQQITHEDAKDSVAEDIARVRATCGK